MQSFRLSRSPSMPVWHVSISSSHSEPTANLAISFNLLRRYAVIPTRVVVMRTRISWGFSISYAICKSLTDNSGRVFQSPTEICSHSDSRYHFSSKITSLAILLRGSRISCRRFDFVIPALCFCMLITPRFSCTFSFARISPYFANSFDPRSPD